MDDEGSGSESNPEDNDHQSDRGVKRKKPSRWTKWRRQTARKIERDKLRQEELLQSTAHHQEEPGNESISMKPCEEINNEEASIYLAASALSHSSMQPNLENNLVKDGEIEQQVLHGNCADVAAVTTMQQNIRFEKSEEIQDSNEQQIDSSQLYPSTKESHSPGNHAHEETLDDISVFNFTPNEILNQRNSQQMSGEGSSNSVACGENLDELANLKMKTEWVDEALLSFHETEDSTKEVADSEVYSPKSSPSSDASSDDESLCGDFQMIFLDEDPHPRPHHDNDEDGGPGGESEDSDDADDPGEPEEPPSDPSSGESDSDHSSDGDNFDFDNEALDELLRCAPNRTVRDALLLALATSIRHNQTYVELLDNFKVMNTLFAGRPFPETTYKLWRTINRNGAGLTKYACCNRCLAFLGRKSALNNPIHCQFCGFQTTVDKVKWFLKLSLQKQLEHFLGFPGMGAVLDYPETRQRRAENSTDDIFDGIRYHEVHREGERNFTFVFNTDGFRLSKKGKISAWGLCVRLNELPPNIRQKHMFLAGIWVDKREPRMSTFLRPFVHQINRLSNIGIVWKPDGVHEITSKFIPLCMCVDAPARCAMLHMTQYNGYWGCTFCTHTGFQIQGSRYPVLPFGDIPPAELRTHARISEAMHMEAADLPFEGVQGMSELLLMNGFDLGAGGNAVDDLHTVYEGVTAFHTELLLEGLEAETLQVIDERLLRIKTHTSIARKPTSITKRSGYNGSDWRNWLLYYAVPCLQDLIAQYHLDHLQMLCHAIFLLSRDSISPEDFDAADHLLTQYEARFQEYHGVLNMRYNVHVLCNHAVRSCRNFGGFWTTSTFNFESWNHNIVKTVTSPKGVIYQIVSRHLAKLHVNAAVHSDILTPRVASQIASILDTHYRRVREQAIGNDVHVLGNPTARRPATEEEIEMFAEKGFTCAGDVLEYERVLYKSTEYRVPTYHPNTKSNNSHIYTNDDSFCTINSIVTFTTDNGDTVCGLFVEEHDIDTPFQFATQFAEIVRESTFIFLEITCVRCPAIKISIRQNTFIVPMANNYEID